MSELHLGPRGLIEVQRGRASLARGRWLVAGRRVAEEEGCGGFGGSCPVERSFTAAVFGHKAIAVLGRSLALR